MAAAASVKLRLGERWGRLARNTEVRRYWAAALFRPIVSKLFEDCPSHSIRSCLRLGWAVAKPRASVLHIR